MYCDSCGYEDPPTIKVFRFTRVVFGVTCSPFLLNATVRHHLEGYQSSHPELITRLSKSIYVDNVVCGAPTVEVAQQFYEDSRKIFRQGGFNLRKLVTSHQTLYRKTREPSIQSTADGYERAEQRPNCSDTYKRSTRGKSQKEDVGERKVLGVRWNPSTDELVFDLHDLVPRTDFSSPVTKHQVISTVGKFYDPLGILAPVVVPFKIFFQDICKANFSWDEPLSGELFVKTMLEGLGTGQPIRVARCYQVLDLMDNTTYRMNRFCDASSRAFAAVIYLVVKRGNMTTSNIVCSRHE